MKLVINIPDYIKEQADDGKGEEFRIPLWLVYEIANGTPFDKIRAEIEQVAEEESKCNPFDQEFVKGLKYALEIIDKYRK